MSARALRVHRKAVQDQKLRELRVWEYTLAEYIAKWPLRGTPPIENLVEIATAEAEEPLDATIIRSTLRDNSFRKYRQLVENDLIAASRQRLGGSALAVVNAHLEGLEWAKEARDPRALAAITTPLLDRLLPKRDDSTPLVAVQVVLNDRQLAALEAPPPEIVGEAIVEPDDAL